MRRTTPLLRFSTTLALLAGAARANQGLIQEVLSFGTKDILSPDSRNIPNWHISQDGTNPPQLLSDRVVLTPPYPGNRRSALWAEEKVSASEWSADFEFRATGPERGGGNLQIWYARDGKAVVGTSSIYTAHNFDGLVLVVDTYGGRGGSIRGFLNDGSTDFKGHHNIDSLAFGHCDYPYRNLGRVTKLQLVHTGNGLEVLVDEKPCFRSDKVKLPVQYNFGISAASAEMPDSFEAFKFVVRYLNPSNPPSPPQAEPSNSNQQAPSPPVGAAAAQMDASALASLQSSLATVLSRLDNLDGQIKSTDSNAHNRHQETVESRARPNQLNSMESRIQAIEGIVMQIQRDVEGRDYKGKLDQLQTLFEASHSNLMTHLPASMGQIVSTSAPRMWIFVSLVIIGQMGAVGSYIVYKRRRANAPKKYL